MSLESLIAAKDVKGLSAFFSEHPKDPSVQKQTETGRAPIHWAVLSGDKTIVELLLQNGADVNAPSDEKGSFLGYTAAHFAAAKGDLGVLEVLANYNANWSQPSVDGWTPLHVATFKSKHAAMRFLLEHGSDVNAKNSAEVAPLFLTASSGRTRDARLLLEHGASVTLVDGEGNGALHYALHYSTFKLLSGDYALPEGQLDVAVVLAVYGATPLLKNVSSETATVYTHHQLPSLEAALELICSNSGKLLKSDKEWNFLTFVSATAVLYEALGIAPDGAAQLEQNIQSLNEERLVLKQTAKTIVQPEELVFTSEDPSGGKCPYFRNKHAQEPAHQHPPVPAGHPNMALHDIPEGEDPSGGKCPFLRKRAAHHSTDVDDGRPLCPFSVAFVRRHKSKLVLAATSFAAGFLTSELLHRRA
ncbi:hypothetical protein STCU_04692 [Strigomonas culicis]|uniref:Uncharacterized protein n=1 Tax=Strigomonas culicis TaxID=28005 RepID=S9VQ23_9TRYP|nr:hypothetical protein STCU_04692 [Strigomonas culicis]|eukprot:EPY29166.1 hypothetical protein STCU_04692 [Strigomonas culicis]